MFSSTRIFKGTTSKLVIDLHDAERGKRQRITFQRLDDPPECTSKNSSWKTRMISVKKDQVLMPQSSKCFEPSSSLLSDRNEYKMTEHEIIITLSSIYLHNTKMSTANTSLDFNHIISSLRNQFFYLTPQMIDKTTFHPKTLFSTSHSSIKIFIKYDHINKTAYYHKTRPH